VNSLQGVARFIVSPEQLARTQRALRKAGRAGYELFVLWSGIAMEEEIHVRTCHVPYQTSSKTRSGLLVRVEGQALHELNIWLYEHGETLAAQVHAHPTRAFHSDTDDTYPIVTTLGGLSLVVPDFARRGVLVPGSAAYRLSPRGWDPVALDVIQIAG